MGKRADISDASREDIIQFLLDSSYGGKPPHGKISEAATIHNVCLKTVTRLWKTAEEQRINGERRLVTCKRTGNGKPSKWKVNEGDIEAVHFQKRGTIRALAESIKVPKTTVGKWVQAKLIRAHTNAIKPDLTSPNKLLRLSFCLQAISYDSQSHILKFKPMENTIHIDEKWFYLTKNTHRFYTTPLEEEPHRTCKSKKFIPKVMFMCAVCRPIFDGNKGVIFDGKIGMWPFTAEVEAIRNSKKRPAGTMEIKPIESITKTVIGDCIIKQIIPAIKLKWPDCLGKTIAIQQDNAKPHIHNNDVEFQAVANEDGFNISLVQQPHNSTDLNVNDLGYFRAIQNLQNQHACQNAEELVDAVLSSFNQLELMTLNKVFLSLQCCITEILKVKGSNSYKVPHMKKNALLLQDALPINLEVDSGLVKETIKYLDQEGFPTDIGDLRAAIESAYGGRGLLIPDLNL